MAPSDYYLSISSEIFRVWKTFFIERISYFSQETVFADLSKKNYSELLQDNSFIISASLVFSFGPFQPICTYSLKNQKHQKPKKMCAFSHVYRYWLHPNFLITFYPKFEDILKVAVRFLQSHHSVPIKLSKTLPASENSSFS